MSAGASLDPRARLSTIGWGDRPKAYGSQIAFYGVISLNQTDEIPASHNAPIAITLCKVGSPDPIA